MVIWMVGLSGSGKTTLGRVVVEKWRAAAPNCVLLDGDELRDVFAADQGPADYTLEGRRKNAERLTALCKMLDRQGINVVCCILSVFPEMRAENRSRFSQYFEVFMDAPLEVLQTRDVKGLYASAARGEMKNVVGIDIPFQRPTTADMTIRSDTETPDLDALAEDILQRAGAI